MTEKEFAELMCKARKRIEELRVWIESCKLDV